MQTFGFNPSQGKNAPIVGGGGFQPNAAGGKVYGQGRPFPNMGRTTSKAGYGKRDALVARQKALQRHMQGGL